MLCLGVQLVILWSCLRKKIHDRLDCSILSSLQTTIRRALYLQPSNCNFEAFDSKLAKACRDNERDRISSLISEVNQDLIKLLFERRLSSESALAVMIEKNQTEILKQLLIHAPDIQLKSDMLADLCQLGMTQEMITTLFQHSGSEYVIPRSSRKQRTVRSAFVFYSAKDRSDADKEAQTITSTLTILGFQCHSSEELYRDKILATLKENIQDIETQASCLLVCIMGHGRAGCVHDINGNSIEIDEVLELMRMVRQPIPKILIVQACQQEETAQQNYDLPVWNSCDSRSAPFSARTENRDIHINDIDMCVIMATSWGLAARRMLFIPLLSKALEANTGSDIVEIFKQVCFEVSPKTGMFVSTEETVKQIPLMMSTLRKRLVFLPKRDNREKDKFVYAPLDHLRLYPELSATMAAPLRVARRLLRFPQRLIINVMEPNFVTNVVSAGGPAIESQKKLDEEGDSETVMMAPSED